MCRNPISLWLVMAATVFGITQAALAQDVAILHTDTSAHANDVQSKIAGTGIVSGAIDVVDLTQQTPSLSTLQTYDAVFVYAHDQIPNNTAFGDALADYIDAGGGTVLAARTSLTPDYTIEGRFGDDGYHPQEYDNPVHMPVMYNEIELSTIHNHDHPVLDNVGYINLVGRQQNYSAYGNVILRDHSILIASLNASGNFFSERTDLAGRVLAFQMNPVSDDVFTDGYDATTDVAIMLANSLFYSAGMTFALDANTGITLGVGTSHTIQTSELEAGGSSSAQPEEITYTLLDRPSHGQLDRAGNLLDPNDTFTQEDLDDGLISFLHTGSSNDPDRIELLVEDGTYAIELIVPVDFLELEIVANTGITVPLGAAHVFAPSELEVADSGSAPAGIVYEILEAPERGVLLRTSQELHTGSTFTQAEINTGEIRYERGLLPGVSDTLELEVTNSVEVLPVSVALETEPDLFLSLPASQEAVSGSSSHWLRAATSSELSLAYHDADALLQMTLEVDQGELELDSSDGLTVSGEHPGASLTLEGTATQLNAALAAGIKVELGRITSTTVELSVAVEDSNGLSDAGTVEISFDSQVTAGDAGCAPSPARLPLPGWIWLLGLLALLVLRRVMQA